MCRWQVQVYVYCAWRIHGHLRCTQCSIMLYLMAKGDHGVNLKNVYLLTSIILYKKYCLLCGCKTMYSPVSFIIGWAIVPLLP